MAAWPSPRPPSERSPQHIRRCHLTVWPRVVRAQPWGLRGLLPEAGGGPSCPPRGPENTVRPVPLTASIRLPVKAVLKSEIYQLHVQGEKGPQYTLS